MREWPLEQWKRDRLGAEICHETNRSGELRQARTPARALAQSRADRTETRRPDPQRSEDRDGTQAGPERERPEAGEQFVRTSPNGLPDLERDHGHEQRRDRNDDRGGDDL